MAKPELEPNLSDSELTLSMDGLVFSTSGGLQWNLGPVRLKFVMSGPRTREANLYTSFLEQSSMPLLSYSLEVCR